MGILAVDEVMLREPMLLVPRRTPVSLVRLDAAHALAKGLVALYLFFQRSQETIAQYATTFAANANVANRTLNLDGTGDWITMNSPVAAAPISIGVVVKSLTEAGVIAYLGATGAAWDGWYIDCTIGTALRGNSVNNNTFNGIVDLPWSGSDGTAIALSATTTALNAAVNGVLGTPDTSFTDPGTTTGTVFRIGASGKGDNDIAGSIYLAALWSRALTPAELQSWTYDPYQFLIPA